MFRITSGWTLKVRPLLEVEVDGDDDVDGDGDGVAIDGAARSFER